MERTCGIVRLLADGSQGRLWIVHVMQKGKRFINPQTLILMMKKLFLLGIALMLCGASAIYAKDKVEVTLNDGTVVAGEALEGFMYDDDDEIVVTLSSTGKKVTYKSTDVKSLQLYDKKNDVWHNIVPLQAQSSLPSLLKRIRNLTGFRCSCR